MAQFVETGSVVGDAKYFGQSQNKELIIQDNSICMRFI
jgi:hypothetical protein